MTLCGDGEPAVLDERAGVDQVGDVLARGAPATGVPLLHRVGTRRVLGQRATVHQMLVVGAQWFVAHPFTKASRSALMTSACVVGMPCGKPW